MIIKATSLFCGALVLMLCAGITLKAEEAITTGYNPEPAAASNSPVSGATKSADRPLAPDEKFIYAVKHSIASPTAYLFSAAGAGWSMATDAEGDRDFGMGAEGFGRRWAHRMGKTTISQFTGSWAVASLLHEDPRYYPARSSAIPTRVGHAFKRVVVTRDDSGSDRFNTHTLVGILTAEAVSRTWRPEGGKGNTATYFQRVGQSLAWTGVSNLVKEFFRKN